MLSATSCRIFAYNDVRHVAASVLHKVQLTCKVHRILGHASNSTLLPKHTGENKKAESRKTLQRMVENVG